MPLLRLAPGTEMLLYGHEKDSAQQGQIQQEQTDNIDRQLPSPARASTHRRQARPKRATIQTVNGQTRDDFPSLLGRQDSNVPTESPRDA
jgi:hypothetical protein